MKMIRGESKDSQDIYNKQFKLQDTSINID